jgi:hypothetical protein
VDTGEPVDDLLLAESSVPTAVGAPLPAGPADPLRPEDDPDALPEHRSLHWVASGIAPTGQATGVVIGHEPGTDLRDLAIIPTLLRTWTVRRAGGGPVGRLRITRHDLRRHRRRRGPERALVLVLDHTARRGWDCAPGLAPHLRWAYDQIAAVSVIELGHLGAAEPLRPERYRARSVADRRIVTSLNRAEVGSALRRVEHLASGWSDVTEPVDSARWTRWWRSATTRRSKRGCSGTGHGSGVETGRLR